MMKGSTNTQAAPQNAGIQNTGPQNTGSQGGGLGSLMQSHPQLFNLFRMISNPRMKGDNNIVPSDFSGFRSGTGSKGAVQPQPQAQSAVMPTAQAYANYQQMPVYSSQPAAPSNALTQFMSSGYASGGEVEAPRTSSLEDDIEAAIRIARMIGKLTKNL